MSCSHEERALSSHLRENKVVNANIIIQTDGATSDSYFPSAHYLFLFIAAVSNGILRGASL